MALELHSSLTCTNFEHSGCKLNTEQSSSLMEAKTISFQENVMLSADTELWHRKFRGHACAAAQHTAGVLLVVPSMSRCGK